MKLLKKLWKHSEKKSQVSEPVWPELFRPDISILIAHIKEIYYEKAYGEYAGGTLSFRVSPNGEPITDDNYELVFCNFSNEDATPEYLFWLAMCYLKYRATPTSAHYEEAQEIIRNWPNQDFVAKELLCL